MSSTNNVIRTDKGLDLDWKFEVAKESPSSIVTLLCSSKKLEAEIEYHFDVKSDICTIGKTIITPKNSTALTKELFSRWDIATESEIRFNPFKNLYTSFKFTNNKNQLNPCITFTNLYKNQNLFCGLSYTFATTLQYLESNPLEVLVGLKPNKDTMAYIKHRTSNLKNLGKFTLGYYITKAFVFPWLKRKEKDEESVVQKKYKGQVEGVVEAYCDYVANKQIAGRIAGMLSSKKRIKINGFLDTDLNLDTSVTYHPTKGLNFILFNHVDIKKMVNSSKEKFHNYGFTVELTC